MRILLSGILAVAGVASLIGCISAVFDTHASAWGAFGLGLLAVLLFRYAMVMEDNGIF